MVIRIDTFCPGGQMLLFMFFPATPDLIDNYLKFVRSLEF